MEYVEMIERVLQSGANVVLNSLTVDAARRLVLVARSSGASITFVGGYTSDSMIELATLGGKSVTFDLAKYPAKD